MPTRALSDDQIENCFGVLAELRPHLQRDNFLATVRAMEEDGYKLVYMADQGRVVAVAGYRIYSNLFMGKHLYVDDLVTTEQARRPVRSCISIRALSVPMPISFIFARACTSPAFISASSSSSHSTFVANHSGYGCLVRWQLLSPFLGLFFTR